MTEPYLDDQPAPAPARGPLYSEKGPVLSVRDLKVSFQTDDGLLKAVDGVSFDVDGNQVLGIVGESGSGKSVTSMAILGLLPPTAKISGQVLFKGEDLLQLPEKEVRKLRGGRIAMVFQDALAALNPVFKVGSQIAEAVAAHNPGLPRAGLRERAIELLELVGIPNHPAVLIADEPTTALDVTIQAQVLEVLERIQQRTSSAIVLITHDLGVVAGVADRVLVMYAGRAVENGDVDQIFYDSKHPYTLGLLASLPRLDRDKNEPLFRIKGQPPSLIFVPPGCAFHPRCEYARLPAPCATERPVLHDVEGLRHSSACHFADELEPRAAP